jgi:hypothetical protein
MQTTALPTAVNVQHVHLAAYAWFSYYRQIPMRLHHSMLTFYAYGVCTEYMSDLHASGTMHGGKLHFETPTCWLIACAYTLTALLNSEVGLMPA